MRIDIYATTTRAGSEYRFGNWEYYFHYSGWYFDTATSTLHWFEQTITVADEREVEEGEYNVDPAQFHTEILPSGDRREWTHVGQGQVTYVDVKVVDPNACTLLIERVDVVPVSFSGGANGEATVVVALAQGSLLFSLDDVTWQESPTFTGLASGYYIAYVKDNREPEPCRAQKYFIILQSENGPSCDILIQSITVTGDSRRNLVTVAATSSNAPIRFTIDNWKTEQTEPIFENLPGKVYRLHALDAAGCMAKQDFEVPIIAPTQIHFSRNPIFFEVQASAPGREIQLQLYVESEHYLGDYRLVITRRRPALSDRSCSFELDGILHTLLNQKLELPNLANRSEAKLVSQGILNYFVVWCEIDPATSQPGAETISEVRAVLKGGLPPEQRYISNFFSGYLLQKQAYLTWQPLTRAVGLNQPEFAYFLLQRPVSELLIRRRLISGETVTHHDLLLSIPIGKSMYQVLMLPVLPEGLKPDRVELTVYDTNLVALSETRRYRVDFSPRLHERYFLYENSFGCFETLRATGPASISIDGKDEVASRVLRSGSAASLGQQFVYSQANEKRIQQSTGLKTPAEMEGLQEFVFSASRYEVRENNLLPIILSKRSFKFDQDSRRPEGYAFEYDYAFDPTTYSKLR